MANLPKFKESIKREVVDPAIQDINPFDSGYIVASYYKKYDTGIDEGQYSPTILCDVSIVSSGSVTKTMKSIPMLKIGGLCPALPPIGALAVVAYIGGRGGKMVVLGWTDSGITEQSQTDHESPGLLPRIPQR